jgi:hypothetical protein
VHRVEGFSVRPAPDAALAGGDPGRRMAIRYPDGRDRHPGLTRPEAERAIPVLAEQAAWDDLLIAIELPVLLSEGAGPHLVAADGALVLALADHPGLPGRIAMSASGVEGHLVGLVLLVTHPLWVWRARALVSEVDRVGALDALDAVADTGALERWASARPL